MDGGFYVVQARPRLLAVGTPVRLGERRTRVSARRGGERRPIIRVEGIEDREGAEAVRGSELVVEPRDAPALGEDEWWAGELEGCEVFDGERRVGIVVRLVELPSCEALEVSVDRADACGAAVVGGRAAGSRPGSGVAGDALLIPMVRDAIRAVDVIVGRIDVDMAFVEG